MLARTDIDEKTIETIVEMVYFAYEGIDKCDCCRLGLVDGHEAYIVPMNFGYDIIDDNIILYFHCASKGRKTGLFSEQSVVSFEMDTKHELVVGDIGCGFSYLYQSVMGTGTITTLSDREEKTEGLQKIMEHYTSKTQWEFDERILNITTVLKLSVKSLAGKEH